MRFSYAPARIRGGRWSGLNSLPKNTKDRPLGDGLEFRRACRLGLTARDVLCLQAFGACLDFELNLRSFFKSPVSVHLNRAEMNKYILTAGPLDKAIALGGVKPFHYTFFSHY